MALKTGLATAAPHEKLNAFFGLSIETQRRIGTLVVLCSMLEMQVEHLAIALKGEAEPGKRIWTDGKVISDLITEAKKFLANVTHHEAREVIHMALDAVGDLTVIRNTFVHGIPIEATANGETTFVRNKLWFGEVRRREQSQVEADDSLLDRAAGITDVLFRVLGNAASAAVGVTPVEFLLSHRNNLQSYIIILSEMKSQALAAPIHNEV